jgi:phage-related protein
VNVYPNPVVNQLTVQLNNSFKATHYEVYNMMGEMVAKSNINSSSLTIDVTGLSTGVYSLSVSSENQNITSLFIKN